MKFKNSILHITNDKFEKSFTLRFSYDLEKDEIRVEDFGIHNSWAALEGNNIYQIIRYAMLDQNYNEYVYGTGKNDEFFYSIEDYYKATHQKKHEELEIGETPAITKFKNKIKCLKLRNK